MEQRREWTGRRGGREGFFYKFHADTTTQAYRDDVVGFGPFAQT